MIRRLSFAPLLLLSTLALAGSPVPSGPTPADLKAAYERADQIAQARGAARMLQLEPHWFAGDRFLWYRKALAQGASEFVLVDIEKRMKNPAFDHQKLAAALAQASGKKVDGAKLPFQEITLADNLKTVQFDWDNKRWECDLAAYACKSIGDASTPPRGPGRGGRPAPRQGARQGPNRSPDQKLVARLEDGKIVVASTADDSRVFESALDSFAAVRWAPSGDRLVAFRVLPGDRKQVFLIESSPRDGGRAKLVQRDYDLPGDKLDTFETYVIELGAKKETKVDLAPIYTGGRPYLGPPNLDWTRDGKAFRMTIVERGYQRAFVVDVNLATLAVKTLVDERPETFVDSTSLMREDFRDSDEMLWRSERDGWGRLYLVDTAKGAVNNAVTPPNWIVRSIVHVDEKARTVIFTANNTDPAEDPYYIHAFRVNLDGTGLVALTDGDGTHTPRFAPGWGSLVDTYSRVDSPPVHVLRTVGSPAPFVLETADLEDWKAFHVPDVERFSAKGRDGESEIYGVVYRPSDFDPSKRYPIIENLYAGPHDSFVPKAFSALNGMQQMAELGFIVVQIDGMGTRNRGKKFHDVCWKNIADAGFPDRILWMKALAAKYPYVDISRVGVYGTSAGGQSSTGALLFHPEFYKVAVSSCGCHDNRMDKVWWNEQWMGVLGPHYEAQSNITNAGKLEGNLLLMLGEMDTNVPPESTLRLVDALIKAKKEFDFVMLPGFDHTSGGPYGERKRRDFFVKHLLGVEPPSWNGG
ncbi:MAG: S9 family peptidase [Fimbriimonadaceae bacterium]|nr:S9 family peptidase [Fimbriimonadaceae bacterium]